MPGDTMPHAIHTYRTIILPERLVAGVLVGGRSRRMGTPKALLAHPNGGTFLEHVARVAAEIARETVLLGGMTGVPDSLRTLRNLPDAEPGAGPLGGLCALLEDVGEGWGLLLSCDMPLLDRALLDHLSRARSPGVDAVAYLAPDGRSMHACCALYHTRVLPVARKELGGSCRPQSVLRSVRRRTLTPMQAESRALTNVNTVRELNAVLSGFAPMTQGRFAITGLSREETCHGVR